MGSLLALDFLTPSAPSAVGASSASSGIEYALDIRDSAVLWVNDIETDKQYRRWSESLMELLRPTFPGMLRSVRKNIYNLVKNIVTNFTKKLMILMIQYKILKQKI